MVQRHLLFIHLVYLIDNRSFSSKLSRSVKSPILLTQYYRSLIALCVNRKAVENGFSIFRNYEP